MRVWTDFCRLGRGAALLLAGTVLLVACETTAPPPGPAFPAPRPAPVLTPVPGGDDRPQPIEPQILTADGLVLPHMEGRELVRIGLLLPFTSKSAALRAEARSMLSAAQMAIFEAADPRLVLMPKDTSGTPSGAFEAAQAVIKDGAAVILGPVLGNAVSSVAGPAKAANIPVIAFSTDRSVAGNGVYLLSFLPEADIERMLDYLVGQNEKIFEDLSMLRPDAAIVAVDKTVRALALLRPDNGYGDRIEGALFSQSASRGLYITDIARYGRDSQSMAAPARQIAHVEDRNKAIKVWEEAGGIGDPGLDPEFAFFLPYQAIFLPESGVRLRSLAPLLPINGVDPKITHFIGTSLWNDEELLREPALFGGWFPAPNAKDRAAFAQNYQQHFSQKPSRLASLAHDGVMIIPQALSNRRYGLVVDPGKLETGSGFLGADGLFRFNEDGLVQRALSVFEIRPGKFREIDPAPTTFERQEEIIGTAGAVEQGRLLSQ